VIEKGYVKMSSGEEESFDREARRHKEKGQIFEGNGPIQGKIDKNCGGGGTKAKT